MAMISRHYKLPVDALERIDDACERFERCWRDGSPESIEDLLAKVTDSNERSALLAELIGLELDYKSRQSDRPNLDDYITRFPDDQGNVRRVFREVCGTRTSQRGPAAEASSEPSRPSSRSAPSSRSSAFGNADSASGIQFSEGRYVVMEKLGVGGFATVYRAFDQSLQRDVAIKVPHAHRVEDYDLEAYLNEARLVAKLDHPAIVPVYDTGRSSDGVCYVVSKLIKGRDLAQLLREGRPRVDDAVAYVARVAEALIYAHQRGLVHRDLKPANILVDATGLAYVTDFGLALETDAPIGAGAFVGTPAYMSPEQAASESHLIDHRTDIFSLGVILYELLTGRRPFAGARRREVLDSIREGSCASPSQLVSDLPPHLDRICMRALATRISDRYASAHELRKDLLAGLSDSTSSRGLMPAVADSRQGTVLPRGLRSFDESDADHFVELLPGPFDAKGMPTTLSFWLNRINPGAAQPFRVGLLSGRSGSGKSSLVKAGLIPRLGQKTKAIFIEASAEHTEATLLEALHRELPKVVECNLVETFAELRRREDEPKVVIFIDQFEQWLQRNNVAGSELVAALRHCDGHQLQTVLMVRDEFGMMAARLLYELDVRVEQGENFATVTTLPERHARLTLARFGQALGQLPDNIDEFSQEQNSFLDAAIEQISENGRVIPVHLALFTEILRDRNWDATSMTGIAQRGLGVAFLEQNFGEQASHPECRLHRKAARRVLRALLPARDVEIKGSLRTRDELLDASGYARQPEQFDALLQLLDRELRLVTPAEVVLESLDSISSELPSESAASTESGFLLAHDFMVGPLREWLTQQDKQSMRGRAVLCLVERASWWESSRANQQLPSLDEWLNIHLFARSHRRTVVEHEMMQTANRRYLTQLAAVAVLLALSLFGWQHVAKKRDANALAERIVGARQSDVRQLVEQASRGSRQLRSALLAKSQEATLTREQRLNVLVALSRRDNRLQPELLDSLMSAKVSSFASAMRCLAPLKSQLLPELESVLGKDVSSQTTTLEPKFRAACGIATMDADRVPEHLDSELVGQLIRRNLLELPIWTDLLQPMKARLGEPLETYFGRSSEPQAQQVATTILAQLYEDDPDELLRFILKCRATQLAIFLPAIKNHRDILLPELRSRWAEWFAKPKRSFPNVAVSTSELLENAGGTVAPTFAFATRLSAVDFDSADGRLRAAGYELEQRLRTPFAHGSDGESTGAANAAVWRRGRLATHHGATECNSVTKQEQAMLYQGDAKVRQILLAHSTTSSVRKNLYFLVDARYRVSSTDHASMRPDLEWTEAPSFDEKPRACLDVVRHNSRVKLPPAPLNQGNGFTIEAWVNEWSGALLTQSSGDSALWMAVGGDQDSGDSIGWMNAEGEPACRLSLGVNKLQGLNHVALVFDGQRATCYLNGEMCDSAEAEPPAVKISSQNRQQTGLCVSRPMKRHAKVAGKGKLISLRISDGARYSKPFTPQESLAFDEATLSFLNVSRKKLPLTEAAMPEERLAKDVHGARWARKFKHVFLNGFGADLHQVVAEQLTKLSFRPVWFAKCDANSSNNALCLQSRWSNVEYPLIANTALRALANVAVCLTELDDFERAAPAFALRNHNGLRSFLITRLADAHCRPALILKQIERVPDAGVRQALILALSEFGVQAISEGGRAEYVESLRSLYRRERNAGVHSAIEFLFQRWQVELPSREELQLSSNLKHGDWTLGGDEHKFVVIKTPNPLPQRVQDRANFAAKYEIGLRPVSNRQYAPFAKSLDQPPSDHAPDKPVEYVTFFDAAAYCNWLSKQAGIPESQWCFVESQGSPSKTGAASLNVPEDYLKRRGYRLPTMDEWRLACSGGTKTFYFFGQSRSLMDQYVWYSENSSGVRTIIGLKKPNGFGLFDSLGNVREWVRGDPDDLKKGVVCGSDRQRPAQEQVSFAFWPVSRRTSDYTIGFRVARTLE